MSNVALQGALFDVMNNDATLIGALSTAWGLNPIFSDVPQIDDPADDSYFPFISFGPDDTGPWDDKDINGFSSVSQINVWTRSNDYVEAKAIGDRLYNLFHRTEYAILGLSLVTSDVQSVGYTLDPDGHTRRGLMLLNVIYEET